MGPILYFKGGSEVAAAIPAKDVMIAAGDDAVEFYTFGSNKQKVSVAVTDATSADTVKLIADALSDLRGINGAAIVVRDVDAGTSLVSGLGAVTITVDAD
tara:strand:+ start:138 stop:437 length:300 start_codon:yes stop_codon:yes gene_type:complete